MRTLDATMSARYFPNVSPRAYYSPYDLKVHMPEEPVDPALAADPAYKAQWIKDRHPVLVHEYQHSIDHLGTVAGRQLLDGLFGALHALDRQDRNDVSQLWRMIKFHDVQRRFFRRGYYTTADRLYRPSGNEPPRWIWEPSVGATFDVNGRVNEDDPVLFIRFTDADTGQLVSRQPLSAAALFEARAVYVELESEAFSLHGRGPGSLEWQAFVNRQIDLLYDQTLTDYSAPAHIVASVARVTNSLEAYQLAAYVAGVVLNLPPDLVFRFRLPARLNVRDAARRLRRLADRRDPGLLFASIVAAAPEYRGDALQWLEGGMREAGLPSIETVFNAAYRHLIKPTAGEVGIFRSVYFQLLANGSGNNGRLADGLGLLDVKRFQHLGTVQGPMSIPTTVVRQNWNLPSAIPPLDSEGEAAMSQAASDIQSFMSGFLEACR